MNISLSAAHQFLDLLEPGGAFTFQVFPDRSSAAGSAAYPHVLHGTLEEHAEGLCALNASGAGVFVMVNAGDGIVRPGAKTCRTAANVVAVRAAFVDLDGAPLRPVLDAAVSPDWVVESSPSRWHAYWKVEDCPLAKFGATQSALAGKFNGDPSVKDLPRVMRVPGFVHWKREPFVSELYLPEQYSMIKEFNHE